MTDSHNRSPSSGQLIIRNLIAAITVSFIALSLGAAFGMLSGRGAFAGMLSAAIIATITSVLGGTRVQCSGPTGPMTTVTAAMFAAATTTIAERHPGLNTDHFMNVTLYLTAALLIIAGVLRLGKFISLIPNVVVSGFMNGIAIIIWIDQAKRIFGLGGKAAFTGSLATNLSVVIITAVLVFTIPVFTRRFMPRFASILSGTFLSIIFMTAACALLGLQIERVNLSGSLKSVQDVTDLVAQQFPTDWSWPIIAAALPFALQLTVLAYLDTLMTSLVVDKMTNTKTRSNQELAAQGVAHLAVGAIGGIAGAQATIRSVLLIKEGACFRWTGILVGVFALLEMLIFQDWIKMIPQAVFAGILIKVGYDVFDWRPIKLYVQQLLTRNDPSIAIQVKLANIRIDNMELAMIFGTTLVTIAFDLNIAVAVFTAIFYTYNKLLFRERPMRDLKPFVESELTSDEA